MANVTSQSSHAHGWKELYIAALLEGDRDKMASLIVVAERAIVQRVRELFKAGGDNIGEEEDLNDALYALHALKNCLAGDGRAEAA